MIGYHKGHPMPDKHPYDHDRAQRMEQALKVIQVWAYQGRRELDPDRFLARIEEKCKEGLR